MNFRLHNTLTRRTEEFKPLKDKKVRMYACGPTVYNYAHLGNLRSYVCWDVLRRALAANGFKIKYAMNITDVGHLTSDSDEGEDKMEKGAKREGKSAWAIAEFYTDAFKKNLRDLNITEPTVWCRATEHIKEQIKMIKKLKRKGFAYRTADGIYFDTAKLPSYGRLAGLRQQDLRAGLRVDIGDKKNPADFALWKFSPKLEKRQMEWKSPWGVGFPGWHIECSAMSAKYLGLPFDIHCGGIDHIPVHHTNEIAQTEAAEGKEPARFWLHNEFLVFNGTKMAKSDENFITLNTLTEKGFSPLAYRYFLLQTHYRKQLFFSWEALEAAESGLKHLYRAAATLGKKETANENAVNENFFEKINDDLDTPGALSVVWDAIKEKQISLPMLLKFDRILGLKIKENLGKPTEKIPTEIQNLVAERDQARKNKNWAKSDELRDRLIAAGYKVEDGSDGTKISKK